MPGVVTVVTGADLLEAVAPLPTNWVLPAMPVPVYWVPASEVVRFQGEGIAAVVAADAYTAVDAADAIDVDYEPLPAVTDPRPSTWQRGLRARLASICPWCVVISSGSSRTRRLTWCSTRAAGISLVRGDPKRYKTQLLHWLAPQGVFVLEHRADATAWTGDRSDRDGDHPKTSPGSSDPNSSCNDSTRRTSRAPLPFGPTVRGAAYRFGLRAETHQRGGRRVDAHRRRCVDDVR